MHLQIYPTDIVFFADESGDEKFSDPNHPLFAMGGCAAYGNQLQSVITAPWKKLKADYFGGAEVPLHASDLHDPSAEQLNALAAFFSGNRFFRFATAFTKQTAFVGKFNWLDALAGSFRKRAMEIIENSGRVPGRVIFLHEASERGDKLLERHFGRLGIAINGHEVPIERGIMSKQDGGAALEVADFIVQAVGGQARANMSDAPRSRKDFDVIFKSVERSLTSYMYVEKVEKTPKSLSQQLAEKRLKKKLRHLKLQPLRRTTFRTS